MPSVGELFISLGFDVDDATLKKFDFDLKSVKESMLGLGAVAAATVGTLAVMVQHSADGAMRLSNMATQFGVNTQAAQTFANALHQINNAISLSEGTAKYQDFSNFINAAIRQGKGGEGAGALARIGVGWTENLTPEEALSEARRSQSAILKGLIQSGQATNMDQARAIYSDTLLKSIPGLSGTLGLINQSDQQYNAASQYNISQENIDKLNAYAQATAELDEKWNKFSYDFSAMVENALLPGIHNIGDALDYVDGIINGKNPVRKLSQDEQKAKSDDFWGFLSSPSKWGELLPSVRRIGGGGNLPAGVLAALNFESGMNPDAYGHGAEARGMPGEAYGIGQWHRDRQALFKQHTGRDIHGSSLQQQMDFVAWELMNGDPGARRAGRELDSAKTLADQFRIFEKYSERPAGAGNISITVNSTADAKTVAEEVRRELQTQINRTYAQTNTGAPR